MSEMEKICRPIVHSLCEYWYYAQCGVPLDMNMVNKTLRDHLAAIREQIEDDGHLKREFSRIEQPLVFFIDYTIKEGHFPFSYEWREIARDYNELSGDEKFFEQLSDCLDDPDSSESLMMFFLFMGLGFDGCYIGEKDFVLRKMKVCATRFPQMFPAEKGSLSSDDVMAPPAFFKQKKIRIFSVQTLIFVLLVLCLAALTWNFFVLYSETSSYRKALKSAVIASEKLSIAENTISFEWMSKDNVKEEEKKTDENEKTEQKKVEK